MNQTYSLFGRVLPLLLCLNFGCDDSDEVRCDQNFALNIASQSPALCESKGSVTVTSTGQNGGVEYRIGSQPFQSSAGFEELDPGTYVITARNESGCETTLTVTIEEEASDLTVSSAVTTPSTCQESSGTLTVEVSGASASYQYRLNEGSFQSEAEFINLPSGEYSVLVQDADGCTSETTARVGSDITYSGKVQDIITTNCAVTNCHVSGQGIPDFSNKATVLERASGIKSRTTAKTMPPPSSGRSLTDDEIAQVACWVDGGAPDN